MNLAEINCIPQNCTNEFLASSTPTLDPEHLQDLLLFQLKRHRINLESDRGIELLAHVCNPFYPKNDVDHGLEHINNTDTHGIEISKKYGTDENIFYGLRASIRLHDIVRYNVFSPAQMSALIAQNILMDRMRTRTVDRVVQAIDQHSSSSNTRYTPNCTITKHLYEADKADTNRNRWVPWGLNSQKYEPTQIEAEYESYLEWVEGSVCTHYTKQIIEAKKRQLIQLKERAENHAIPVL